MSDAPQTGPLRKSFVARCQIDIAILHAESELFYAAVDRRLQSLVHTVAHTKPLFDCECEDQIARLHPKWLSPRDFWMVRREEEGSTEITDYLIGQLRRIRVEPPPPLQLARTSDRYVCASIEAIENDLARTANERCFLAPLQETKANEYVPLLQCAFDLVGASWPSAKIELEVYVREVVLVSGRWFRSSSISSAFGAVFLLPRSEWNPVHYADLLLHECAHHALYVKESLVRFLDNPDEYATGSLRDDARPIRNLMHALFVLARVLFGLRSIAMIAPVTLRPTAQQLIREYDAHFDKIRRVVRELARPTQYGIMLLDDVDQLVATSRGRPIC